MAERASTLVVGLPLERNGTEAAQAALTRRFAQCLSDLAARYIPESQVFLWDERYSTQEAEVAFDGSAGLDALAACVILDSFFAEDGEGAELVPPQR
ncbi:hypothetical protein CTAYLR_007852 [Chrysophaeum taylorii]|uniref:Holliday junction resolvase n=1 Tax=Chrysophaeum taylorii TaxID=2483200 RepID=A0AAD7UD53_9STRA|nr:hypothetical protein CTAYLR_007852 [Chrysophaeum taylorii]